MRSRYTCLAAGVLLWVGCGGDDTERREDTLIQDCSADPKETQCKPCGTGEGEFLCVDGQCIQSACGDSCVDERREEQCDDGNDVTFDGCEPSTCVFTCNDDAACDDGVVCNGVEKCDLKKHTCSPGAQLPDESDCQLEGVPNAWCLEGECLPTTCGNGDLDEGEQCDDGRNEDVTDGCKRNCTFTCDVAPL